MHALHEQGPKTPKKWWQVHLEKRGDDTLRSILSNPLQHDINSAICSSQLIVIDRLFVWAVNMSLILLPATFLSITMVTWTINNMHVLHMCYMFIVCTSNQIRSCAYDNSTLYIDVNVYRSCWLLANDHPITTQGLLLLISQCHY